MIQSEFKTVSNAIELAMIASSTAVMQACKREAPPAKTVDLSEIFGRDSKRQLVSAVRKSSVAFNSLDRNQVYNRNVQQRFWTGSLCQLC